MESDAIPEDILRRMAAPEDLFLGTGAVRPICIRNVLSFCRLRARDLGDRKSLHHRYVLCFNLEGGVPVGLLLNNVALRLMPGKQILFTPHQLHTYTELDDRRVAMLFVTFETDDGDLLFHLGNRVMDTTRPILAALNYFIGEYLGEPAPRRGNLIVLSAQSLLETIIIDGQDSGVDAHIPIPAPLKEALRCLSDDSLPTVLTLAHEAGLSEAYLRKLFKKYMGISLGRYLTEMRLNKARSLLGASDESVSRISELCGYASVYAFSRSFHSYNGLSPSGYRNRIRKNLRR